MPYCPTAFHIALRNALYYMLDHATHTCHARATTTLSGVRCRLRGLPQAGLSA